jgi:hypothetical protein
MIVWQERINVLVQAIMGSNLTAEDSLSAGPEW